MCGIAGAISFTKDGLIEVPYGFKSRFLTTSQVAKESIDYFQHRGQDSLGIVSSRQLPGFLSNKVKAKEKLFVIYYQDGSKETLPINKVDFDVIDRNESHCLFSRFRNLGMVNDKENLKDPSLLDYLKGDISIGATRYGTTGNSDSDVNAPPQIKGHVAAVMNGDIVNVAEKREFLKKHGYLFSSTSDVEDLAAMLDFNYRVIGLSPVKAIESTLENLIGGFFGIAMFPEGMGIFSDQNHIRPGGFFKVRNKKNPNLIDAIIAYSETSSVWNVFHNLNAESLLENSVELSPGDIYFFERAVRPNIKITENPKPMKLCYFEKAYFSRPDAVSPCRINGQLVYKTMEEIRREVGKEIAYLMPEEALNAKFVVPVLTSADFYAVGVSDGITERKISNLLKINPSPSQEEITECLVPYNPLLILNKYVPRTFIMPPSQGDDEQAIRVDGVMRKHSFPPIISPDEKFDIILVDDSIVRGNSQKTININKIKKQGNVRKIHSAIGVPPLKYPCFYAIDLGKHLIASNKCIGEVKNYIGADTLTYGTKEIWQKVVGDEHCWACIDGNYPTWIDPKRSRDVFETKT